MSIFALYLLFVKYGFLCFGGGYALVPLITADLVNARGLMTPDEFAALIAVAQVTPGPIGINTATYVGFSQGGIAGAVIASLGIVTPAVLLVILAMYFLKKYENTLFIRGFLAGVRPAAFGLILVTIVIFAELSIFSSPIPAGYFAGLFRGQPVAWEFLLRPVPLLIAVAVAWIQLKKEVPMIALIAVSALVGALLRI